MLTPQSKAHRLADPVATCGDRVYCICSQNGLFPDSPGGHVPREMWGVWDHPVKLLDGFWFGLADDADSPPQWLCEADACRVAPDFTEFDYRLGPISVTRRDFAPDGIEGMVVTLTISAPTPGALAGTVHALFRSDLRPAWLGAEAGMRDGIDRAEVNGDTCVFTDAVSPWACVVAADAAPSRAAPSRAATGSDLWAVNRTSGSGASAQLVFDLEQIAPSEAGGITLRFFIAGSTQSREAAAATSAELRARYSALAAAKRAQAEFIVGASEVLTPEPQLNDAIAWSKLINQMFVRDVPGLGRGLGAGLPEYPWWFGIDTEYAILPLLQSGQFELARDALCLLKAHSEQHNPGEPGRVIHELSSTGTVFNAGNMVEVPAFTRAVHQTWLWTGDADFLTEMYPFCRAGVLDHALGQHDADGDLCPSGRSIIETLEMHAGFEVIDVAAYTWEALTRLADMAPHASDASSVAALRASADALAQRIREEWWIEDEGLFADVRASRAEVERTLADLEQQAHESEWLLDQQRQAATARRLFEPYLARHAAQPREVDLPWLLRHWVVMCPVEVGLAVPTQAERVLDRLGSSEFCNEWGMYLHPERHDVMSINTGLLALANARYGRADQALEIVRKLVRAFSYRAPGAVGEALPDQWCFLQLWSNLGLVSPVVEGFLGIAPRAAERVITIKPNLPSDWAWAEVRQLRVGDVRFDIRVERDGGRSGDFSRPYRVTVRGGDEGWTVESS